MVKLSDIRCPYCSALPIGTAEMCVATFARDEADDTVEWSGTIDTDNSTTMYDDTGILPLQVCQNGHTYTSALFTDDALNSIG